MTMDSEEAEAILAPDWDRCRRRRKKRVLVALAATAVGVLALASVLAFLQVFQGWDEGARLAPSPQPSPSVEVAPRWPIEPGQFAAVRGGDFVLAGRPVEGEGNETDCRPLYLTGWNAWDIARAARISPRNHKTVGGETGKEALEAQLAAANAAGLNVVRAWAHTVDPSYPVMRSPGVYDEAGLDAIDFLLDRANKHGVRVILSFVDNWKYAGGVDQMVDFSPTAPARTGARPEDETGDFDQIGLNETAKEYEVKRHALFFTDEGAREVYKGHVRELLERVNSYSGVVYKEDPTIFAWNLINEPRCESWLVEGCEGRLQGWIEEMSAYVKLLDPNHLVTVGGEGFYAGPGSNSEGPTGDLSANPADWAAKTGQDFVANHAPESIDFATIHLWPDNWNQSSTAFQEEWIRSHAELASSVLKKPVIVQEFGKKLADPETRGDLGERDSVYEMVNKLVESDVEQGGSLKGSLFWNWEIDLLIGATEDPYTLRPEDSTFDLVRSHALRMQNLSESRSFDCGDLK